MILAPSHDTLITMARLVFEASELAWLNVSFSVVMDDGLPSFVQVSQHDDTNKTSSIYEVIPVAHLVASYIGLSLTLDLDANDAVTTGHRLGNTGR